MAAEVLLYLYFSQERRLVTLPEKIYLCLEETDVRQTTQAPQAAPLPRDHQNSITAQEPETLGAWWRRQNSGQIEDAYWTELAVAG